MAQRAPIPFPLLLEAEQAIHVAGLDQFADQRGGGDEANSMAALPCSQAERQGDVRLAGPAVAEPQDDLLAAKGELQEFDVARAWTYSKHVISFAGVVTLIGRETQHDVG